MELSATYENGRLIFDTPVRFKNRRISLRISVPDDAVDVTTASQQPPTEPLDSVASESLRSLVQRMRQIRGTAAGYQDDGRTDSERFSEELDLFYR
ncbi:MAG: hypothetical protein HZB55_19625 [Deltaproteobacteria bacterium]|nr:hypothetical protein [Deltaproteobacteria bacterium]